MYIIKLPQICINDYDHGEGGEGWREDLRDISEDIRKGTREDGGGEREREGGRARRR